jgi:Domain of unknown function (DUF4129)
VVTAAAPALTRYPGLVGQLAAGPPIGRQAGQRLARGELSKAIYHPRHSLAQRLLGLADQVLDQLFRTGHSFPGGWWAVVALATLAVLVVAVVRAQLGPLARASRASAHRVGGSPVRSAADHRSRAGQLAAAGDYAGAILEGTRAIASQLEERGVLAPRPGRTASEIAAEAGRALPSAAGALRDGARLFDDTCYGQHPGTAAGFALIRDLDQRVSAVGRAGGHEAPAGPAGAASTSTGGTG